MVIVFFGTPQFAVPTLEALLGSRHQVPLVVTQPDKRRDRGQKVTDGPVKAAARAHGVPVFQPERLRDPDVAGALRRHAPDLAVVAAYGKLIPSDLLTLPRLGMLNVHASLLPKYRGAAPVHRAIMNGEAETGVTIMRIVEALDAGDMLAKSVRVIGSDETSEQLEQALAHDGASLLLDVLDQLEAGTLRAEPQDESASTYAPRLRKEEGLIDWTQPARRIHDQVRGLYPWPHAYSYLDGARLIVWKTEVRLKADTMSVLPGTIVNVARAGIEVATGAGLIALTEVQAEGRRPMRTRDFLAGRPVRPGMKFGS
ncbi:MAG TPA: methionyl-tRNA formyltransferase [Vicinamibacterales bacterium]|nr:methionyl-tRNA formyltransferase [Vicinamibacterales bacterium]